MLTPLYVPEAQSCKFNYCCSRTGAFCRSARDLCQVGKGSRYHCRAPRAPWLKLVPVAGALRPGYTARGPPSCFFLPLTPFHSAVPAPAVGMPCDIPASSFAGKPELRIEEFGTQYLLTLLPKHQPSQSAPKQALDGWGWADDQLEGLGVALRRYNVNPAGHEIWRRTDGVMVCASNAATRRKLMTFVNQTVEWGTEYYRNEPCHYYGEAEPWICSIPAEAPAAHRASAAKPCGPSQATPRPLTAYGGPVKRGIAVCLQPNPTARPITPPPEGPRKRLQRIETAEAALLSMSEATSRLHQETVTLRGILRDLRRLE